MSSRKYNFSHLTDEQLAEIAQDYPTAVEIVTIKKPVYRTLSMMAECGARLSSGKRISDMLQLSELDPEFEL